MDYRPPEPFDINEPIMWPKWRQKFEIFMKATGKLSSEDDVQVALLLHIIGDSGLDIYNTFPVEKTKKLKDVLQCFDEYLLPKKNITMETFKFNNIIQTETQTIDSFITELKRQAANCQFICTNETCNQSYSDRMIKDRVILGIRDKHIQQRLIREPDMSLLKIQEYCKSIEISKQHLKLLSPEEEEVNAVKIKHKCQRCGFEHQIPGRCPAYNKTCAICQKKNHFAKMCFANKEKAENQSMKNQEKQPERRQDEIKESRTSSEVRKNEEIRSLQEVNTSQIQEKSLQIFSNRIGNSSQNISTIVETDTFVNGDTENIFIYEQSNSVDHNGWHEYMYIANHKISFKLDTGAESSVLPVKYLKELNINLSHIEPTPITIVSYGNFKSKTLGQITLNCMCREKVRNVRFLVVEFESEPLLGLRDCLNFNLITRLNSFEVTNILLKDSVLLPKDKKDIYSSFKQLFEGIGCIPGLVDIKLKVNAIPVVQTQRKVPLALHNRLKAALDDLEQKNIISKVNYPTDWVNSLMIVEKPNGSLRLCLDPKPLNKYICREHYLIPKCDNILSRLVGKKMFTVIDMKDGFWQLELTKRSSDFCTFNTPFGRYKFNRVPFGISSAPEIFQRKNYELFGDIPNLEIYFDDMIICGKDELEHDLTLKKVFERALLYNIKFNFSKLQYKLDKVNFLGQVISENGLQPNKKNIDAVLSIESPKNKKELLRILGLFKFFSKFIPNLSQLTYNMRSLTKNNTDFKWTEAHEQELCLLKTLITSEPILKIFDENKKILIQADASSKGIGCVLLQNDHPVAFASRSLNSSEEKYAQIEKELLGIIFAFEKFHYLVYGRSVLVQTDHKPLISIFSKNLDKVTSRLQRMLLKMQKYTVTVEFIPGSQMYIADTLSRSYMDSKPPLDEEMEYIVHSLSLNVPMTSQKKNIFQNAINNEPILSKVKYFCSTQWPKSNKKLDPELKYYYNLKNDIYLSDNLLFYNTKIIVPKSLRNEMLNLIHEAHFGIQKSKLRARQIMFWPKMSSDIENFVNKCERCQLNRPCNQKESLRPHTLPERPWQFLYSDFLEHNNRNYLLIVDAYSHWLEVFLVPNKTASIVIDVCKDIFSKFGVPDKFFADNNPYNSFLFKEFAKSWNFELEFSSPHYHQSNGLAEKYVDITKRFLNKSKSANNLYEFLMQYRNTPLPNIGYTPAQLLLNRNVKTKLPITVTNLEPKIVDPKIVSHRLETNRDKQKEYYDKTSKDLPSLKKNEIVLFKKNQLWEKGKVIDKYNDRSYIVKDSYGNEFRRNRKLINKTNIPFNNFNENFELIYEDVFDEIKNNSSDDITLLPSDNIALNTTVILDDIVPDNDLSSTYNDMYNILLEILESVENISSISKTVTRSSRVVKPPDYLLDNYVLY